MTSSCRTSATLRWLARCHSLISISCLLQLLIGTQVGAVSPGRLGALSREDLLKLDNEVSQFYMTSYAQLDRKNATFEQHLYDSIRALRHTTIVNHFDFRYTNNQTKWRSMGARVNRELCKYHLELLVGMANSTTPGGGHLSPADLPLSAVDFFSASGQTGSGVMNGNFAWLGSATSCQHASIPAATLNQFIIDDRGSLLNESRHRSEDMIGRYCVAHMRAKSWPKWDMYFEERITIRRGLCLPEACHSAIYDEDTEIRAHIAILARYNLQPPFNDHQRFEVSHLYCLPDEDSEYRQLDLGARLFIAFIAFWTLVTIWVQVKFQQRKQTMKQLRHAIDIRMIINDAEESAWTAQAQDQPTRAARGERHDSKLLGADGNKPSSSSACSSAVPTPLPSDIEDDNSDLEVLEPFKVKRSKRVAAAPKRLDDEFASHTTTTTSSVSQSGRSFEDSRRADDSLIDFVRALSIESNLKFLFYSSRPNFVRTEHDQAASKSASGGGGGHAAKPPLPPPQLSAFGRRSSSSNEALVKDLASQEASAGADHRGAKVAIVSGSTTTTTTNCNQAATDQAADAVRGRRVDIEVLDGLKVIATSYIVYGHTMMFFFGCINDMRFGVERMFDFTMIATLNTLQIVGLFYVITGCLLTYFSFSKTKLKQLLNPIFWLLVLVGRYFRLIPAYALVFWFARHVAPYTGAGRDWYDYRTDEDHARGACGQESWWVMWTMSAADVKIPNDCLPQAWYLSDDFRTLMVLPVYVFLLAKNARVGYAAIFATFCASFWKMAHILKAANIDYKIVLLWHPHVYALMTDRLHDVYTDFLVRMSTYLLGVIVGHLLYLYEIRYIRTWPRWFTRYGMKVGLLTAAAFYFGALLLANPLLNQFLPHRDQLDSDTVVWIIPLFKGSMELAICVILLLLVTGHGNKLVRQMLASRPMKILSNISYAVFLTHIELMYKAPATSYESNYWYLFIYAGFYIAISHVVAFFLYLLWEMPINNLTRNLFKKAFHAVS